MGSITIQYNSSPMMTVFVSMVVSSLVTLFVERRRVKASRATRRVPGFKPQRMSKWVVHNGRLETQGMTADPAGDIEAQTRECLAKLEAMLLEAGASKATDLLSMTIFLADLPGEFSRMNAVYDAWVADVAKPTRLCVQAALDSGCKIEIRCSATCDSL